MKEKSLSLAPFMSERKTLSVGLNQLGMRSVGEQLFGQLLPGLNNVSSRIRYYSFYCWLFREFYKGKEDAEVASFRSYYKNAEYLLALINHGRDGIPGITYANEQYASGIDYYNLLEGINGDASKKKYWANAGGIFIQYYVRSMLDIGIIGAILDNKERETLLYKQMGRGEELADSFEENIGEVAKQLFLKCLKEGHVSDVEIEQLSSSFNMKHVPENSREQELLVSILLGLDYPTQNKQTNYRKNTIYYILDYSKGSNDKINDLGYIDYMYDRFHTSTNREGTLWGWYAYAINEDWQYQSSFVFSDLLATYLRDKFEERWVTVRNLVDTMSRDYCELLGLNENTPLRKAIDEMPDAVKRNKAASAICRLLKNYVRNLSIKEDLKPLSNAFHSLTTDNYFSFMDEITKRLDKSVKDFLTYFITDEIIYRHYQEAFRKIRTTGIATQKFVLEGGCIRFLSYIDTTHSSPRVETVIGFLTDLGLLADGRITEYGIDILKELEHDRAA